MEIEGNFSYSKSLVLTKERILDLVEILEGYCERIKYEVVTINNLTITFQSKEELLAYDNYGKKRIKELTISGYSKYSRVFRMDYLSKQWGSLLGYWKTVKCSHAFSDMKDAEQFKEAILLLLRKATPSYWWVGKISTWGIIWISSALSTVYYIFTGKAFKYEGGAGLFFVGGAIAFLIIALSVSFDYYIIGSLYPPISFAWGEELNRAQKNDRLRGNIFWVIVIGIIVGLLTSFLFNKIFA